MIMPVTGRIKRISRLLLLLGTVLLFIHVSRADNFPNRFIPTEHSIMRPLPPVNLPPHMMAAASVIVVTTTSDELNDDSDCSLREAITAANSDTAVSGCAAGSGADTITFDITGPILLFSSLPDITSGITIMGPGEDRLSIVGHVFVPIPQNSQVFKVTSSGSLTVSGLTFNQVRTTIIWNADGIVMLDQVRLSEVNLVPEYSARDSIIDNSGTLTITNSVVFGGVVPSQMGVIHSSGTLTLANTILYRNGDPATNQYSDALVISAGTATLVNNTISENADSGLRITGGAVTVQNTIISASLADNCAITEGVLTSLGHNIDDQAAGSCGFSEAAADLPNGTDPRLSISALYPVENWYGYAAYEVGLFWDSPAIDAGDPAACAASPVDNLDHRGEDRPLDGDSIGGAVCDIGAFELSGGITQAEYDALVALSDASNSPDWLAQEGWLIAPNPCGWQGIVCRAGHVVQYASRDQSLSPPPALFSGPLPPEIGDLIYLEIFELMWSDVTGIPPEIASLGSLRYLNLGGNPLTGPLPAEIGDLISLEYLDLSGDMDAVQSEAGLTGTIPASIGGLVNLRVLHLGGNQFTGAIPPELGALPVLTELHLGANQLTGPIPPEFADLSRLTWLNLQDNPLGGGVPAQLTSLLQLQVINLENTGLTGPIPPDLDTLNHLLAINLANNQLSGAVPIELGSLPRLLELQLQQNRLTGSIPSQLGGLANLYTLDLSGSRFTGTIPPELGSLANLHRLYLQKNALSGEIPTSLTNLASLLGVDSADIGYNMLWSTNPAVIDFFDSADPDWADTQTITPSDVQIVSASPTGVTLSWTPILYMSDGGYYEIYYATSTGGPFIRHGATADKTASGYTAGSLLPGQTYYFKVRTLTPNHNGQQNDLFSAFSPVVSTTTPTSSTFCQTVSEIPQTECEALEVLYNSTNGGSWSPHAPLWFSDSTPCDWYGITCAGGHVTGLGLHVNLQGSIPPSLLDLPMLTDLDFGGGNHLIGSIPPELGALASLQRLVLSENQLTGGIPVQLGDLSALQTLYLDRNQLSGPIPIQLGQLSSLRHLALFQNQLTGSIPAALNALAQIETLWLSQNQFTGPLPAEFGGLSQLTYLDLTSNQLSGMIPPQWGSLASLTALYLGQNQLDGSIPPELGSLVNLTGLRLDNNQLSGEVPAAIANLVNLVPGDTVSLGYNALSSADLTIIAFLDVMDPDWAATQTIPPANIQVINPTTSSLELSWTPIPYTADGGYYEVYYATTSGGPYTLHGKTPHKIATGYTAGGLLPGTDYYFQVRTFTPAHGGQQNALTSAFSAEVTGTTGFLGLIAPTNLVGVGASQTEIILTWQDNAPDETAFSVERSPGGVAGWEPILPPLPADTTTHTQTGLDCHSTHYYRVRAYRADDDSYSAYTNVVGVTTQLCDPPAAPSNLVATGISLTQIMLTWQDNALDETAFDIQRSIDTVNWTPLALVGADVTTYTNSGLACGKNVYYRVRAYRAGDNQYSAFTVLAHGMTQPCLPPNAPTLMSVVPSGPGTLDLLWSDNSSDEDGFSVEHSADGLTGWVQVIMTAPGATSFQHTGLVCNSTHHYRLRAYRSRDMQFSQYSVSLSALVPPCPPPAVMTIGLYQGGQWLFRDANQAGPPSVRVLFGPAESGWTPLLGDWNGDGEDGIALYRDGIWLLRERVGSGPRDLAFIYNPLGAGALPVVGDWNGDGLDTVGVYRDGQWALRNTLDAGLADIRFIYNPLGAGALPVVGDWNGDGLDTVGVYLNSIWYLNDQLAAVTARQPGFRFGPEQPGWLPVVGDWNGDGLDSVGLYKDGIWRLRNTNTEGPADLGFTFSARTPGWLPIAGYHGDINALPLLAGEISVTPEPPILTPTSTTPPPPVAATPSPVQPTETPLPTEMPPESTPDVTT